MTTVEPDNVNILKVSSVTSDSSSQSATVSGSDDDSSTDSTSTSTDDGSDDSSTTPVSTTSTGVDNSRRRQLLEQPSQVATSSNATSAGFLNRAFNCSQTLLLRMLERCTQRPGWTICPAVGYHAEQMRLLLPMPFMTRLRHGNTASPSG